MAFRLTETRRSHDLEGRLNIGHLTDVAVGDDGLIWALADFARENCAVSIYDSLLNSVSFDSAGVILKNFDYLPNPSAIDVVDDYVFIQDVRPGVAPIRKIKIGTSTKKEYESFDLFQNINRIEHDEDFLYLLDTEWGDLSLMDYGMQCVDSNFLDRVVDLCKMGKHVVAVREFEVGGVYQVIDVSEKNTELTKVSFGYDNQGFAVTPTGDILTYVNDRTPASIVAFNPDGGVYGSVKTDFTIIDNIEIVPSGELLVTGRTEEHPISPRPLVDGGGYAIALYDMVME